MKNILYLLISIAFYSSSTYAVGGTVGNGGFVITCATTTNYLSLDYVLAKEFFAADTKIQTATNLEESLYRIADIIDQKMPSLSKSFLEFINNLNNESDDSKPYFWNSNYFGLSYETDDQAISQIPFSCEGIRRSGGWLKQVVIREMIEKGNGQKQIVFEFDQNLLHSLPPLQASFIYVHEWLWNLSTDVQQNRKINYFLHSDQPARLTAEQVQKQMKTFGVDLTQR